MIGSALNLSPLAYLLLWIWHPCRSVSRKKRCLPGASKGWHLYLDSYNLNAGERE